MKHIAMILMSVLAASGIAKADIMLSLNSGPVTDGGNFDWTYTATLKSGSTLQPGYFFTIYDIGGFGVATPIPANVILPGANWSSSIQFLGVNGFGQAPTDSATIANVTYTFTGASAIVAASDTTLGGGAGAFGYISSSNSSFTGDYTATTHVTAGGATAGNISTITVAGMAPAATPEVSTLVMSGCGLLCLGLVMRRRGRRT